ncbi:hypothetical protein ACFRQM_09430 [Streptomyces sp. NPDC056831]|uniref:hypothetical protein n=1 Tax=Streptomyces sp. NPDC056831 TaxID=3345954 RepID=UPI0036927A97
MPKPNEWLRAYDSGPVADVDPGARYRKEVSDDGGSTWAYPRQSTGEHLRIDATDVLVAGCSVEYRDGSVIIQSPHPAGGLIRYTPAR